MPHANQIKHFGGNHMNIDATLKVFDIYIQEQDYFDIVYSEKIGYVRILVNRPGNAGAEVMDTPETLLYALFNDIIGEVINALGNRDPLADSPTLNVSEETDCRHRITEILGTIKGDSSAYLDSYLKQYQERYKRDGE